MSVINRNVEWYCLLFVVVSTIFLYFILKMGRSRGGGGGRRAPPPARRGNAPPPAQRQRQSSGPGLLSSLGSTMVQGFAFGTGSSLARTAVDSVMGGGSSSAPQQYEEPQQSQPSTMQQSSSINGGMCSMDQEAFMNCLKDNNGAVTNCQFFYDALQACQQSKM